jgi:hypothetical protein
MRSLQSVRIEDLMTSEEYADRIQIITDRVKSRVLIQGDQVYSLGNVQRFEEKDTNQIVQDALEEIEDLIAYACQLHIKLTAWRDLVTSYDRNRFKS